ncbi:hypothetical protein CBR_g8008 [Chara braunii]|uniref:Uncharacterized protein n=1 Tax=Chara braunii TaxID=69332 RepID=A0A388KKX6_CHABU|nr:hypothetical protein CBR_g8008 [Chara braunii]|eukprot:GBG70709.1 hypothetical protein CBR_g8008 [Chara braunii]
MERNPTQSIGFLDFVSKKEEGVVFLGKSHARNVWELLKAGLHIVVMEGNSNLLQFMMQLVKSEVNLGTHNCEFMVMKATRDHVWSNKMDMWFKLSERKRNKIYDFLFLQMRSRKDTDAEYVRRKDLMFSLLDNYHGASHMNAKTLLERLQSLYFVQSEEELKFDSYASLISTSDKAATSVELDANAKEEGSDTESLDLEYDPPPTEHARGSSSAGKEGAKGDVGIGDDEGEDSEDDVGFRESFDEFEQLYDEHRKDDVDDDEMTMEIETQVVSSLSAEPEDYEVQPLTSVVDLQHRFDEASIAMSPFRASYCISIEEVIDDILGDQHVSAHPSTTHDFDDTRNVKPFVAVAFVFSPPNSPILLATLANRGEGEVGGRQYVMSPKKYRVGTQTLDVLALPAPTSPMKERRDKSVGKL